jgi:hypothetical protein
MPQTSWALVDGPAPAGVSIADALVDAVRTGRATEQAALLDRWGSFVRTASPAVGFAATADNVACGTDGALHLLRAVRQGVDVLDGDAPARSARVCLHLAATLVHRAAVDEPRLTVDALALRLGGRGGLVFDAAALDRARAHEATERAASDGTDATALLAEAEALGATTVADAVARGEVHESDVRLALVHALDALSEARTARDTAEAATVELAAARALALSLGEELERDEWIRARLRNVKSTAPVRALIAARKRVAHRA